MARVHPRTAETIEETLVIEAISEVAVDVVEDEEDGAMIVVIEAARRNVITEFQEMTEDLRLFETIEAGIAIDGIVMIALEAVDRRLLKAEPVHPTMDLAKSEMPHRPWIWTAPEEAQEMDHSRVAPLLQILCNRQALVVGMDEAEVLADVEEATTMIITLAIHHPIQTLTVAHNPLPHLRLRFRLSVQLHPISLFQQPSQRGLKQTYLIQHLAQYLAY